MPAKSLQLCPTPWDCMDYSPLGSSLHAILQARILEWVAMPFSRGYSWPRHWTCAFELWCWRRIRRVPWTARRSNPSILKEMSPEYSLKELMLKLQYVCHLIQRTDSLEKTLMLEKLKAGGEGDDTGWDDWMTSPTDGHEFEQTSGVGDGQGGLACCSPLGRRVWHNWVTELNSLKIFYFSFY